MVRRARRSLPLALLSLALAASSATAQPGPRFDAQALVGMEGFGAVRLSEDGRWAAIEREGPYDQAPTYAYGVMTRDTISDLLVFDASGRQPPRAFGPDDDAGYRSGPISPDGRRMAVYRLQGGVRTLGVLTFETGDILWTAATPDFAVLGRTVAWRNDQELVAITTPAGALPLFHRLGLPTQAVVAARWEAAAGGDTPTAVALYSGRGRDRRARAAPGALVRIAALEGTVQTVARGEFIDLEVSPDGRRVAALANAEDLQPRDDEPPTTGTPQRRRQLVVIDLVDGQTSEPAPEHDLLWFLLAWSPDSDALLAFGRPSGRPWSEGGFLRIDPVARSTRPVEVPGARPALLWSPLEKAPFVRAGWSDDQPVLFVEEAGRRFWRRADGALFSDSGDAYAPLARSGERVWLSGVGARRVGAEARAVAGRRPQASDTVADAGGRDRFNPDAREIGRQPLVDAAGCLPPGPSSRPFCPAAGGARLLAASQDGAVALVLERDPSGPSRLRRLTAMGEDTKLVEINATLERLSWGPVRAVPHSGADGRPLKSWLLLPSGAPPPGGWPMVVLQYPGAEHASTPPDFRPGAWNSTLSALVLQGAGYAVLIPSLPLPPGTQADLPDLVDRLDEAVDAAIAGGDIDPERVALAGHSYGGHGALLVATRSSRYRAIVSIAGDAAYPATTYDARAVLHPDDGLNFGVTAAYLETGQGAIGAPLSRDVDRWVRASPLFRSESVTTPLLMIWMDQDPQAAEPMFGQLYRHGREAALVTYFGEGHTITSPANIVDLHWRMIGWLDEHLAGADAGEPVAPVPDP